MPQSSVRVLPDVRRRSGCRWRLWRYDGRVPDLGDEVDSQAAQRLDCGIAGPYLAQDVSGAISGQTARGARGCEVGEQHVQAIDGLGAGLDQVVTVFHQGAQGGDGRIDGGGVEPGGGQAATPTETASASSVLRPCPVDSTRTRAASLAGTSTTSMPSAVNRWVSGAPRPAAPSIAQPGSLHRWANPRSSPVALRADRDPDDVQRLQRGIDGGRGPRCLMRIDGDHDTIAGWCFSHGVVFLLALDEHE